jgi:hypothetical protein
LVANNQRKAAVVPDSTLIIVNLHQIIRRNLWDGILEMYLKIVFIAEIFLYTPSSQPIMNSPVMILDGGLHHCKKFMLALCMIEGTLPYLSCIHVGKLCTILIPKIITNAVIDPIYCFLSVTSLKSKLFLQKKHFHFLASDKSNTC